MSVPVTCKKCGDCVGVARPTFRPNPVPIPCPGKGKHPEPTRERTRKLFGLVERVTMTYPAIGTSSSWSEYVGPRISLLFWLAVILQPEKALFIDGKWSFWSWSGGSTGPGLRGRRLTQDA